MTDLSTFQEIYFYVLSVILGAAFGSFFNCMSYRIVHKESIVRGRSHCDSCNHVLGVRDLIPVFGFLINKGKCHYCGAKLSKRHLCAELVSAFVFFVVVFKYGITLQALEYLLFACLLLAVSFADLEGYIIPDRYIIAGIVIKLIFILTSGHIKKEALFSAKGGFFVAIALLIVVLISEKVLKKEAMGGGDIKLIFVTGLFLGWKLNIVCLILSCIVGIVFGVIFNRINNGDGGKLFPFGPSIALAAFVTLLFGQGLVDWYVALF